MNSSINPANQSMYDRIVGGILDTATNAGRYYRSTPDPSVLDFIEQNHNGVLAQPGDAVRMSQGNYKTLNGGNVVRPASMMPTDGNDPSLRFAQNDPEVVSDGSVIRDYQLNNNLAMQTQPALTNQAEPTPDQGVLANTAPASGNRRDQTPMSFKPQTIDNNEMMIRMGGAGLAANRYGATAALGASINEYGKVQDANRKGLNEYNLAMQKAEAKAKGKVKSNKVSPYNAVVLDTLNDIIPALDGDTSWFSAEAGLTGSLMKAIPGTPAADFAAKIDTLKANIGFDRLQKMRDESPTGGALGQVSEMELRQLNAALGSLEQSQSPQQLQQNLMRIREHYIKAVAALEAEYADAGIDITSKIQPMSSYSQPAAAGNLSAADAIVGFTN